MPPNGTIGIFCPSHVADMERYAPIISAMERLGFTVKLGSNFTKATYGYAASAEDLNDLVADASVLMILFSGGDSAVEILPLIDYDNICRNPKLFSSYSDGTSILNAIHAKTGLVTYYGWGAGQFLDLRHYDYTQFCSHFIEGNDVKQFISESNWKTICGGSCEGTLIGGYASLFGLMLANEYYLAFIGQSAFMRNGAGLFFGHYSVNVPDDLLRCLERFGKSHKIPVVYTDDFGHGTRHAILPIGVNAKLDADKQTLIFNIT